MSGLKYARAADRYHDKIRAERDEFQSRIDRALELLGDHFPPNSTVRGVAEIRAALLGTEGE